MFLTTRYTFIDFEVPLTKCGPKRFRLTKSGPCNVSVVPANLADIYYNLVSYVHTPLVP